ncbi:MAG: hypothetical protein MJH10_21040 [Epibacterium sp.]|nr:hypothetical protein [Epibacterium sp.]NQX75942.1 hypothetical protein [Epibacterium sp.]
MLTDIYARSFLTATRATDVRLRDLPTADAQFPAARRKWIKHLLRGPKTRILRDLSDL